MDNPLFYYRPCSDGGYEGPKKLLPEDVRVTSGAWRPLYAESKAQGSTEGFKLIPDLPHGFNHSAYNRHTGEWVYLNHDNTWQLFQGPITQCPVGLTALEQHATEHVGEVVQVNQDRYVTVLCEPGIKLDRGTKLFPTPKP